MNLTIKGTLTKIEDEWVAELNYLDIRMKAPTAFQSIKAVSDYITAQLDEKDNECSVLVEDGQFYLSTTRPRPLIKFVALCLTRNLRSITHEQLNEWFHIKD